MASHDRFGFQWNVYSALDGRYEAQFANWVYPLGPSDFAGKNILDAGCGMGRNSYWSLKWGASKLTAFDYDARSVSAAQRNLRDFPQASVVFADIYKMPWRNEFDLGFSIGVIHHLKEPKMAVDNIIQALKPGGTLLLWLYSYEGNEWIPRFIDPVRKNFTSRMPVRLVYWLSYIPASLLWAWLKIAGGSTPYLRELGTARLWQVHNIVMDQLIPEVANYWKKSEVQSLLSGLPLENIRIHHPLNGSGWTVIATKP